MKPLQRFLLFFVAGIWLAASGWCGPFDSWKWQMPIVFKGYEGSDTLTNFPALIVLGTNCSGFSYAAFASGTNDDLRFTTSDRVTPLSYEIERWDTNGLSYVWVRVPEISGTNTTIWAFWGKSGVSAPPDGTNGATWSAEFKAVWHFNETVVDEQTSGIHRDSTTNACNGSQRYNASTAGMVAGAQRFDGNGDYIAVGNPVALRIRGNMTLSMWVMPDAFSYQGLIARYDGGWSWRLGNDYAGYCNRSTFVIESWRIANTPTPSNQWSHLAVVYDASNNVVRFYRNGQEDGIEPQTVLQGTSGNIYIGQLGYSAGWVKGVLDEARIEAAARSHDWVRACWLTAGHPDWFASFGPAYPQDRPAVSTLDATNVTYTSAWLNGMLISTGQHETTVFVCSGTTDGGTNFASWDSVGTIDPPVEPGPLTTNIALVPAEEYFFRWAASNAAGVSWSESSSYLISTSVAVSVMSPGAIYENGQTGIFWLARSVSLTRGPITVRFTLSGSAENGVDYAAITDASAFLESGVASVAVEVVSYPDIVEESDETVQLDLAAGSYVMGGGSSASLTIYNSSAVTTNSARWRGGASSGRWTVCENWSNRVPPAAAGAAIRFDESGNGGFTCPDPENLTPATNEWRIGSLNVSGARTNGFVDFCHLLDLGGRKLLVDGNVSIGTGGEFQYSWMRLHVTNGTLQIGTTGTPRNVLIGSGTGPGTYGTGTRFGELKICPGATIETHVADFSIGGDYDGGGVLDLRGATVADGIFEVQDLRFCLNGNGNHPRRDMYILLDGSTAMTEFRIRRYFYLGYMQMYNIRIGDPANFYRLPPNISFSVGSPASRGRFWIAANPYGSSSRVSLEATSGGRFIAYLTEWLVHPGYFGTGKPITLFDIRAMTNVEVDVSGEFSIAKYDSSNTMGYDARVRLGPGRVRCRDLIVGTSPVAGSYALLELNGTVCLASNACSVGDYGVVAANVYGTNCGLDLFDNATVTINSGGRVQIDFLTNQAPDQTGTYWGLRWQGDHSADLAEMRTDGTLVWTNRVTGYTAGIYYDAASNETYVALRPTGEWTPMAIPRDLNIEIDPPSYSVVTVAVEDVDAGSFDPTGVPITNMTIASEDDVEPGDPYVTLNALGAHTVWLTVVNSNGVAGSNDCTVTLRQRDGGTTNSLTWDGGARLALMPRGEWMWGNNWVGDVAPTNPTSGTLLFTEQGFGTNVLEADRTIGGLKVNSRFGCHTFDLGGHRLTIEGGTVVMNPLGGGDTCWAQAVFTNGILQIGTTATLVNVTIGSGDGQYYGGAVYMASGSTLETHVGTLILGGGEAGRGILDLRGAVIHNGVFRARDIRMGTAGLGSMNVRPCEIRLDESTQIDELRVDRYLDVEYEAPNQCRIGNPTNGWRFPTNLDLMVGSPTQRGRIYVGYGYWYANGYLGSASGGVFRAWLTDMRLGKATASLRQATGVIDFSTMTNCAVDVSGCVWVGYAENGSSADGYAYGTLKLPRGMVSTKDLVVGLPLGKGLLELYGTVLTVTNSVTVGANGVVSNYVSGMAGGISLGANATLSVSNGGVISIVYTTPSADSSGPYWGLRWEGHHESELEDLRTQGKIVTQRGPMGTDPIIFYSRGATFVGYPRGGTVFVIR